MSIHTIEWKGMIKQMSVKLKWCKVVSGRYESEDKRFTITKLKQEDWLLHDNDGRGLYGIGRKCYI